MSKLRELAIVRARLYQLGESCVRKQMLTFENDLWYFEDRSASTVWDVIEDENARVSQFTSRAIRIAVDPVPTTKPRLNGYSYLESLLFEQNLDVAFKDFDSKAIVDVAKRRFFDVTGNEVRFNGLFELEFDDIDDRHLDARAIRASFLGELDLNQSLTSLTFTVTTAELEARVLAAMRAYRSPMSTLLIADAVNVHHELINDPVLALDHAGLIVSNYSGERLTFSLTDRAKKGML